MKSRDWSVGVDDDERITPAQEIAADQPRKADHVAKVATIDELGARQYALDKARPKDERTSAFWHYAPETQAAVCDMVDEKVSLERLKTCGRFGVGTDNARVAGHPLQGR